MGAPGPLPCTPAGIVDLLDANDVPVEGRHVVVIGRGLTIGRPFALLLAMKRPGCNAAVTVVHTGVDDLACAGTTGRCGGGCGRTSRAGDAPHGQARGGSGGRWNLVAGEEVAVGRGRVGGRGGGVAHAPAGRGRADDPGHAVAQRGASRRTGVVMVDGSRTESGTESGNGDSLETDHRPWGSYTVLDDDGTHKVKRIVVLPGKRLSYQRHARRSEHWFIVRGQAMVTLDGSQFELVAGQSVDIPVGTDHRIENPGPGEVVFVEVQHGEYFGEDDIVRLEDDYGRADA